MSTVVAVKKDGIIAIGADTMTKLGRSKQPAHTLKNHSKILKFKNNYIAHVGDASIGLILNNYFSKNPNTPKFDSIEVIFEFLCQLHKSLKEDYFLLPEEEDNDDFESMKFKCLIANEKGIFGVYELRSVDEFTKFFSFGTGQEFALGAMQVMYDKDYTAEEIARAGIEAAAEFDDSSGLPVEIYTIKVIE